MGNVLLTLEQMNTIAEPWVDLTFREQDEIIWRCISDPVEFANEPMMCGGSVLRPIQAKIMAELYTTKDDVPMPRGKRLYNTGIGVAGMSSGKTHLASRVLGRETFSLTIYDEPALHWGLARGSWIRLINMATSRTQSKETVWDEFNDTLIKQSPYFMSFAPRILTSDIYFDDHSVHLKTLGSSGISAVGRNVKCAVIDEQAKFETEEGKRSGKFVFDSLSRSTTRFGMEGLVFSIGSILHENDPLMTEYYKTQQPDLYPGMIGWLYTTLEMNPVFDREVYLAHKARDPITAARDYDCVPEHAGIHFYGNRDLIRIDPKVPNLLAFFVEFCEKKWSFIKKKTKMNRKLEEFTDLGDEESKLVQREIEDISRGISQFKPRIVRPRHLHVLTGDPAIARDAFGLALAYKEVIPLSQRPAMIVEVDKSILNTRITIDGLHRFRPKKETGVEVDPAFISFVCWEAARFFKVRYAAFDTWNFPTTQMMLKRRGVSVVEGGHIVKLDDCEVFKDRQFYRTIRICDYPWIVDEMKALIKKNNKVDHPRNGSKDVYDAAVLSQWLLDNPELGKLFEPKGIPITEVF